jgi:hypothetical protein
MMLFLRRKIRIFAWLRSEVRFLMDSMIFLFKVRFRGLIIF